MTRTFDPAWGNNGQHREETIAKGRVIYDLYMSGLTMKEAAEASGIGCSASTARYYAEEYASENGLEIRMGRCRKQRLEREARSRAELIRDAENSEYIRDYVRIGSISEKSFKILARNGIHTLSELEATPFETLKSFNGIGPKRLEEILAIKRIY